MKKITFFTISVLSSIIFSSCGKDKDNGGSTTVDCSTVTNKAFAANVSPIIQSSCAIASCHAAGSTNGPGQLISHGEIAAASFSIRAAIISGRMPQSGSLTTAQKNSIICWIDSGSPNN
jgi:hypothetical protein